MGTDLQSITDGTRGAGMAHSGLGSIPGPGVTCGLSLLLVLVLAQRIQVSLSLLVFLPPQKKKQTNKQAKNKKTIQIRPGSRGQEEPPRGMAAAKFSFPFPLFPLFSELCVPTPLPRRFKW